MKKWITYMICILMIVSLVGCHKRTNDDSSVTDQSTTDISIIDPSDQSDTSDTEETKVTFKEVNETVYAKADVNIRKEPSSDSTKVGTLAKGKNVTRTGIGDNGWSRIIYKNETCYISTSYLTTTKPTTEKKKTTTTKKEDDKDEENNTTATHTGNKVICIDAGHQKVGDNAKEPIGPGASTTKPKVTTGATGTTTGLKESVLNLKVAKRLKKILEAKGYEVVMCREIQDVNISNKERADVANACKADVFIRIHADSASSANASGASTLAPTKNNPYLTKKNINASRKLSQTILTKFCQRTGAKNRGVSYVDNMSGINWSEVPVCIIEMGFLSNPTEDKKLNTASYQKKCAQGIADGIEAYLN